MTQIKGSNAMACAVVYLMALPQFLSETNVSADSVVLQLAIATSLI
jgi:hypothetical protein